MKDKKRVLIFTPHPDDHLCAGGTLIKLQQKGYEVVEVLFTEGETGGQLGVKKVDKKALVESRRKEFAKASKILGTTKTYRLEQPNDGVEYSRELFFRLIEIIRDVRPQLALIPHQRDYHRDHRKVGEIVYDALKAADNSFVLHLGDRYRVPVVLCYRGLNPLDEVNLLVDISAQFKQVQKLIKVYSTQMTKRIKQYTVSQPNLAGYYMRVEYAEEFEVPKNMAMFPNKVLADLAS